jgi:molybdenum cofactor cytidylyltransferase
MTTAILILAAGNSVRMGATKQLLDWDGQPLVRHAAEIALQAGCGPVAVVLGANETAIAPALGGLPVEIVHNPRWAEGMGTSIQAGLQSNAARQADGVIFFLADQPRVAPTFLRELANQHIQSGKSIVAARYAETAGVPAFFSRAVFPLLMALGPKHGCKNVIQNHMHDTLLLDCPQAAIDIDTPEDYARLNRRAETRA